MASNYDVIVVGAGVVGCALGNALGKQGRRVLVIERELKEPDRIVGELMQPAGVHRLRDLGLEGCLEGIDSPIVRGYAIFSNGKGIQLSYPKDKNGNQELGNSFHHGKFIMKLRDSLKSVDKVELIQGNVTSFLEEQGKVVGVVYKTGPEAMNEARAPLTIACDGCGSNLRNKFIHAKPEHSSKFYGVIIHDTPLPYPNHGHVILLQTGPVLAYQIGTHETRLLIDLPNSISDPQHHMLTETASQLPESLRASFVKAVQEKKPQSMPNSKLDPENVIQPGVLYLGDSFNMRHPLTGGGMTVGLSDAVTARDVLAKVKDFSDTQAVMNQLNQLYIKRKGYSSTINILSWALYHVFTAKNDPILPKMRDACIAYLNLGWEFTNGPVCLLAGLKPYPTFLMMHFFAVAIFGVARTLLPFPTPRKIWHSYRLLSAASNIVVPLVKKERVLSFLPIICRMLLLTGGSQRNQLAGTNNKTLA